MSDLDLLDQGLAGEHLGIAAYDAALGSGLLEEPTAGVARAFQSDHKKHGTCSRGRSLPVMARRCHPSVADCAKSYPALTTVAEIVAYAIELEAGAARASIASVVGYEDRKLAAH